MKRILAAVLATVLATGAPAVARAAETRQDPITVASLDSNTAKTGWLQVLSQGGSKQKVKRGDISQSPVARELVAISGTAAPGTIIIDNSERRLYHVVGRGIAVKYAVSVGRKGFLWTGTNTVSRKAEWPTWVPPEDMRVREAKKGKVLPASMEGGIDNPLGARAMYLGSTIYRIHGTNQPLSIGKAMSSGCIRMANEDVEHLYANVEIGATVVVRD
ncbi:L,D-transpeptidase [Ensifer sp. 4252]|uniref:L,D-transpeptidase n=1 Tax=Ensifer sp. 4252 TaxID=3373915 RepID=UPI003D258B89